MSHGKRKQVVLCEILSAYKNHPSIKQRQNFFWKKTFFFNLVTPMEIKKLIECLDTNKAAGINIIPLKLIKIEADFFVSNCCNKQKYRGKYFIRLCKNSFSCSSSQRKIK